MNQNYYEYPYEIRPLSEGGGYLVLFPGLPGYMSDGKTVEEAIANGLDAVKAWVLTAREFGDAVPSPNSGGPGKLVQTQA